jgi:hypothetical protein
LKDVVLRLVKQVREAAGEDAELARRIEPLVGRLYGRQAISAWGKRGNLSALALLAACRETGVSVDEALFGKSLNEKLLEGQREIERRLDALEGH